MTKIFVDFKLTDLAKAQTQEFQDYLKNMPEQEWQDKKNTVIRKAIDNMMTDGTYTDYVNNLNAEQKVMRMMGGNKIKSGLGGKAPEEVAKMRGWMWMNSDISKRLNRSLTAKFSDKDNEEKAKIVMHKLNAMEDYLKFLVTNGQSGKEISKEDFDTLIWMVNDRTGKLFPTREDLKPHLQPIFDDLQTALSKQEVSLLDDKQALTAQLSSMLNKMQVQNSAGKRYGQT
jgi:DNA topoisomerase VI subunit B